MRALIVDDDFYSRSFLEYILHPYAKCDAAVNGEDAIMAFKKALEGGDPYTLVFMDLLMPVIDGPESYLCASYGRIWVVFRDGVVSCLRSRLDYVRRYDTDCQCAGNYATILKND